MVSFLDGNKDVLIHLIYWILLTHSTIFLGKEPALLDYAVFTLEDPTHQRTGIPFVIVTDLIVQERGALRGTFLTVQGLRLHTSTVGGTGVIPA